MRLENNNAFVPVGPPSFKVFRFQYDDTLACTELIDSFYTSESRCSSIPDSSFLSMKLHSSIGSLYILSLNGMVDTNSVLDPIYRVRIDILDGTSTFTSENVGLFNTFNAQTNPAHGEWNFVEVDTDIHYLYAIYDEANNQMTINFVLDDEDLTDVIYHTTILDGTEYPRELAMQEDKSSNYGTDDQYKWMVLLDSMNSESFYYMEFVYSLNANTINLDSIRRRSTILEHPESEFTNLRHATFLFN